MSFSGAGERSHVTTSNRDQALSVLRVYLRRRTTPAPGLLGRLFGRSLSEDLTERALRAGVAYATVSMGHMGFLPGARRIVADISDVPPKMLPTCVELVGRGEALDALVEANEDELAAAVLLRLDGVGVSLEGAHG